MLIISFHIIPLVLKTCSTGKPWQNPHAQPQLLLQRHSVPPSQDLPWRSCRSWRSCRAEKDAHLGWGPLSYVCWLINPVNQLDCRIHLPVKDRKVGGKNPHEYYSCILHKPKREPSDVRQRRYCLGAAPFTFDDLTMNVKGVYWIMIPEVWPTNESFMFDS